MGERSRQRDPLLLAARELRRQALAQPGQTDQLEQLFAPHPAVRRALAAHAERELDVLGHRLVAEEGVALEDEAQPALTRRHRSEVLAVEEDSSAVAWHEAGDEAENRALAAPRRTEEHAQLAGRHRQGDVGDHRAAFVALGELLEADRHPAPEATRAPVSKSVAPR